MNKQPINPILYFFYVFTHTDIEVIQQCSNRAKARRIQIGIALLLASAVGAFSIGYLFYSVSHSLLVATVIGVLYGGGVYVVNEMIFQGNSLWERCTRLASVVLLSLVTAMPFKVMVLQSNIDAHIIKETKQYNYQLKNRLIDKVHDDYTSPLHLATKKYNDAMAALLPKPVVQDLWGQLQKVQKDKKAALEEATFLYDSQKQAVNKSFGNRYATFWKMVLDPDVAINTSAFNMALGIMIFIIFIETIPITVSLSSRTDYDSINVMLNNITDLQTMIADAKIRKAMGATEAEENPFVAKPLAELEAMLQRLTRLKEQIKNNFNVAQPISFEAFEQANHQATEEEEEAILSEEYN